MKPTTTIKDIAELFWAFHNARLDDPSIKEMKPYIQPILDLIDTKVKEAVNRATQPYNYQMPSKAFRSRNTAMKLYATKFMNSKLKERRQLLLDELERTP